MSKIAEYPFITDLRNYFEMKYGYTVDLEHLLKIEKFVKAALERVEKAIRGEELNTYEDPEVAFVSFHLGLFFAGASDYWALYKFIDTEVKRFINKLSFEEESTVMNIASLLNVKAELLSSETSCGHKVSLRVDFESNKEIIACFQFRLTIPQYLHYAEKLLNDPKWSLLNQYVDSGYVYLVKKDFVRLLEEPLKNYLLTKIYDNLSVDENIINFVKPFIQRIKEVVKEVRGFTSDEVLEKKEEYFKEIVEEAFPPCIKQLIDALKNNTHLTHHQRFAVATFLLNVGASIDYVLNLMKFAPDYNERIARYQIEHLAGLRGGRKRYRTYSCDKMKILGLCVANCGTRTPLQYYRKTVFKLKKSFRQKKKYVRNRKS